MRLGVSFFVFDVSMVWVLPEIPVVDTAAIEQIRSRRTKTRCLGARIRNLVLPTNAKQKV